MRLDIREDIIPYLSEAELAVVTRNSRWLASRPPAKPYVLRRRSAVEEHLLGSGRPGFVHPSFDHATIACSDACSRTEWPPRCTGALPPIASVDREEVAIRRDLHAAGVM